ncbi:hypothetical protein TRFO_30883 [Tritrichomonas foetus]|uniref:Uncharacterized protein n=1 Tax=Tritrichomonas foetus TaxID=1144522 RepID=A0A1J4JXA2_9EUKA|nr:hypothetical protein TRFO_30883 [Tritrichomonas foetus]|eukprot:OHT02166.1 hypothetical protein TRFO_30883 [Tritrichomonas foetus]
MDSTENQLNPFQERVLDEMRKSGEINHLKAEIFSQVLEHAVKSPRLKPVFKYAELIDLRSFAIANCIVRAYLKNRTAELPLTNQSYQKESSKQFKITANGNERDLKFKRKDKPLRDLLDYHRSLNRPPSPVGMQKSFLPRSPKTMTRYSTVSKVDPNTKFSDDENDENKNFKGVRVNSAMNSPSPKKANTVNPLNVSSALNVTGASKTLGSPKTISHVRQDSEDSELDL